MQLCFRRLYSSLPDAAAAARTASAPRAVRLRRLRRNPSLSAAQTDATPAGLSPTELLRYHRQRAKGELITPEGQELSESEWLTKLNNRRNRIRGTKETNTTQGLRLTQVVGQKIYLPNVIFRLVRNFTPPGQPYNPYEATFRLAQSITKTDIRSYLASVYGVRTTYIRTDNSFSPWYRTFKGWVRKRRQYKRAVVGLEEPFYYPLAMDDMNKAEREQRRKWIEDNFHVSQLRDFQSQQMLVMTRKSSKDLNWKNRDGYSARRGKILERVAEQRANREQFILDTKNRISKLREKGELVVE